MLSDLKARSAGECHLKRIKSSPRQPMKVISFAIFKGGTGKTTSAVSVAAALSQRGKKVLLVDLDQQGSATRYLGLDPDERLSMVDVFMGKPAALVVKQTDLGVDVLPGNSGLAAVEQML